MKVKITKKLYELVLKDLRRPHPFAFERVGFLTARLGNWNGSEPLVLLTDYIVIPDNQYIEDYSVGARINADAIRAGKQHILNATEGVFHVHLHDLLGIPEPGHTDSREIPPIVRSFCTIGPTTANGMLVLSSNKAMAMVWVPGSFNPVPAERISVVGHPLLFLES